MRVTKRTGSRWLLVATLLVFLGWSLGSPIGGRAQQEGNNAVVQSYLNGNVVPAGSPAFIDASVFASGYSDICATLYGIMTGGTGVTYPTAGAVIDARGINSSLTSMTCSSGSPWQPTGGSYATEPSVILLPAATITIGLQWQPPSHTRIVGEGPNLTILQAPSSFSGPMIHMGSDNYCGGAACTDIGIEHLGLVAQGAVTGILNRNSEELSYVNDVAISGISSGGIGLDIEGTSNAVYNLAVNSGPYSNIVFSGSGTCAQINGTYDTRGIRGLTCNMTGSSSNAAVYLDGCSNSIEDVYIYGQIGDGILVGKYNTAQGDLLTNVNGASGVGNLIHISNSNAQNGNNNCPYQNSSSTANVADLTILGATCSGCTNATIEDDLTGPVVTDANVGMYAVGEPVLEKNVNDTWTAIGYSRYTTSPSLPTWLIGSGAPSGSCAPTGVLYSNIYSSYDQLDSLWACAGGTQGIVWTPIK